jgi:hypothetical protein
MTAEGSGEREFPQPVTNHVFCDKDIFKNFTVVDQKGEAHEFRRYLTGACPSFDRLFLTGDLESLYLFDEMSVYIWSFD